MKDVLLYVMVVAYLVAGSFHFIYPTFYRRMMPEWIPWHKPIVYMSGVGEIILAVLLLPSSTRNMAAWGLIILLMVIFPANIQMMLNFRRKKNQYLWVTILRLPLQLVLIWWAWQYTR